MKCTRIYFIIAVAKELVFGILFLVFNGRDVQVQILNNPIEEKVNDTLNKREVKIFPIENGFRSYMTVRDIFIN